MKETILTLDGTECEALSNKEYDDGILRIYFIRLINDTFYFECDGIPYTEFYLCTLGSYQEILHVLTGTYIIEKLKQIKSDSINDIREQKILYESPLSEILS